jgi:N-acetylneuraminic acid mutarotase
VVHFVRNNHIWTQKADFAGGNRIFAIGFSIGNKGYIGTGGDGYSFYKDFWEYNPAVNSWTKKADVPYGIRIGAIGFSIGTKGYIGAGWTGSYYSTFGSSCQAALARLS